MADRAPDGKLRRRMLEQFDRLSPRGQVAAARFIAVLANDEGLSAQRETDKE